MRLDIDVRFAPLAAIIWIISILAISEKTLFLAYVILLLITTYIFYQKSSIFNFLYLIAALATIIASYSHSADKNLNDLTPGVPVIIEVKVVSDLKKADSRSFGIYREDDKYIVFAKTYLVTEEIKGQTRTYQYRSKIQLQFQNPDNLIQYGSKLKVKGYLSEYNFQNISYSLEVKSYSLILQPNYIDIAINKIRGNFLLITNRLPGISKELLPGLILGDTRNQSKALAQDMKNSGLAHLTAVSGGNIAILLLVIIWICRKIGLALKPQVIIGLLTLIFFAFLVRTEPSVVRASFMGAIALLGLFNGTRRHGISALSLTVCVVLLLDPNLATSWGFCLSVFATGGLLIFTKKIVEAISQIVPNIPISIATILAVAFSAQISTAGLVAGFSGQVTIWSVPANLLTAPVIPFVTILGYLSLAFSNLFPSLGLLFGQFAAFFANWIGLVAHYFSSQEMSTIQVPKGFIGFLIMTTFIIFLYFLFHIFKSIRSYKLQIFYLGGCFLVVIMYIFGSNTLKKWPMADWQFVMCDVGQGDGLVIRDSTGKILVVDVGPDGKLMNDCLAQLKVKDIDVLILTHFHADHVEGLEIVRNRHEIKRIYVTETEDPIYEVKRVKQLLGNFRIINMQSGDALKLGDILIQCLWPTKEKMNIDSIPNNASVVNLVSIKNASFLLTGDIEPPAQAAIQKLWKIPQVDVVKVPHHGSKFQDDKFPTWTNARLALISAGKENLYGHPSSITVDLYKRSGMQVLSTDEVGSIAIKIGLDDSIKVSVDD